MEIAVPKKSLHVFHNIHNVRKKKEIHKPISIIGKVGFLWKFVLVTHVSIVLGCLTGRAMHSCLLTASCGIIIAS